VEKNQDNAINLFNRGLALSKLGQNDMKKISASIKDFN